MGKRKTRQEKKIADLRRKLQETTVSHPHHERPTFSISYTNTIPTVSSTVSYEFVKKDLVKTTLTTCVIICAEVLFFYILRLHIIGLPFVSY